ncbi:Predicted oxidoreductase [Chitinophaga terrae (ex Kim and Jung 2007)]|uniref:Predicted oxidoreductase n=1 Tax=Chitinophaga terrae (ex Kim and Jung 2007) TaxID=408074 RepID=A0A1H4FQJ8_9BACT|nr:aldo/keto reductase [Chitinophaga terrae (ex Kim and Jung 2007)]MDQ0109677.1 aryl-alcohol dehydrogenase-like predicted oxidoreductase [Chitinophaga terrae (ex Kim and Jung 2007)]SEA99100.1 Predicted oxidoreductase [Chitinophaga terrae (ex Kim and Jung 2007)]
MEYRKFGRTGWQVSEIGYGMWGMAGWTGSEENEVNQALDQAIELGCNFFDTAWAYGDGLSEQILNKTIRRHAGKRLYVATKIPPKNRKWPSKPSYSIQDVFPKDYIIEYTEKSLQNLGVETIDLQQFHVWEDSWSTQDEWKEAITKLQKDGKVRAWGVSVNRWEPDNCLETLKTGLIDGVQVIYNIFDQAPEDNLLPLCKKLDIGVIARVPFDEGTLTGTLTKDTTFPANDWRASYFVPENLHASVEHADALKPLIPEGMTMPEMALRFILSNPDIATTIPGMRRIKNVRANMAASDGKGLSAALLTQLKPHRWDRRPTGWSQ